MEAGVWGVPPSDAKTWVCHEGCVMFVIACSVSAEDRINFGKGFRSLEIEGRARI